MDKFTRSRNLLTALEALKECGTEMTPMNSTILVEVVLRDAENLVRQMLTELNARAYLDAKRVRMGTGKGSQ